MDATATATLEDIDQIARAAAENPNSTAARQLRAMLENTAPIQRRNGLISEIRAALKDDYVTVLATETLLALRELADTQRLAYTVWPSVTRYVEDEHGPLRTGSGRSHKKALPNPEPGSPDALAAYSKRQKPALTRCEPLSDALELVDNNWERAEQERVLESMRTEARNRALVSPRWQALLERRRQMKDAVEAALKPAERNALERHAAAIDAGITDKAYCATKIPPVSYAAHAKALQRGQKRTREIERQYW